MKQKIINMVEDVAASAVLTAGPTVAATLTVDGLSDLDMSAVDHLSIVLLAAVLGAVWNRALTWAKGRVDG